LSYTPPEADTANLIKVRRRDVMHYTGRQCKGDEGRFWRVLGPPSRALACQPKPGRRPARLRCFATSARQPSRTRLAEP